MAKYAKALVAPICGLAAAILVVATGGEVNKIPGLTEVLVAAGSAVIVYLVPNAK